MTARKDGMAGVSHMMVDYKRKIHSHNMARNTPSDLLLIGITLLINLRQGVEVQNPLEGRCYWSQRMNSEDSPHSPDFQLIPDSDSLTGRACSVHRSQQGERKTEGRKQEMRT